MKSIKYSLNDYLNEMFEKKTVEISIFLLNKFLKKHPNAPKYQFQEIVVAINDEKIKNIRTRGNFLTAIKRYYDYLIYINARKTHPCKNLILNSQLNDVQFQDLFTMKELVSLLDFDTNNLNYALRNKVIFSILIFQALHVAEIEALKLNDIDFDKKNIFIKGSKYRNERILDLQDKQLKIIENYIDFERKQKPNVNNLITKFNGEKLNSGDIIGSLTSFNKLLFERKLTPTKIRQSVIAHLLSVENNSLESVQLFAGHRWPSSTQRYYHPSKLNDIQIINNFFPKII